MLIGQEEKLVRIIRGIRKDKDEHFERQVWSVLRTGQAKDSYVYVPDMSDESSISLFRLSQLYIPFQFNAVRGDIALDYSDDTNGLSEFRLKDREGGQHDNQVTLFKRRVMGMMGYKYIRLAEKSIASLPR